MLLIALIALMSLTHSVEGGLFCKKGSATISFYDKELDKTYKVKVKDLLGKNKVSSRTIEVAALAEVITQYR